MKKLALSLAIVLGMTVCASAQGGFFGKGPSTEDAGSRGGFPGMPGHGETGNQDGQGQQTPLAGGALLLIGFGAAYAMKKRNEK